MLELVELPGFEQRKPTQISGGQAQRVALARALINRPGVLLLDEPLGALDLKLRKQMQVELKRIQQEVGITFIYVTHDQEEAMTMSDRIAVMNQGRYEQLGDPETLYERPATRFVGRLPRRQQPAAAASARARPMAWASSSSRTARSSRRRPPRSTAARRSTSASGPRRSGCTTTGPRPRPATTISQGVVADASYLGVSTQYIVETRGGARVMVYEQNIERTTKEELWSRGRPGPPDLVPDHTLRRSRPATPRGCRSRPTE